MNLSALPSFTYFKVLSNSLLSFLVKSFEGTSSTSIKLVTILERLFDPERRGYIFFHEYKSYIYRTFGTDKTTVRKYLDILETFGLAKRDKLDYERINLTYRDSNDYKMFAEEIEGDGLKKWLNG